MRHRHRQPRSHVLSIAIWLLVLPLLAAPAAADKSEPLEPTHPGLVRAQAKDRTKPTYPHEALLVGGPEAKVLLRVVVEKSGKVSQYQVLESSQPGLGFEESAAAMINLWKYRPALLDGKKVRSYAYVQVSYVAPFRLCLKGQLPAHVLSQDKDTYLDNGTLLGEESGNRKPVRIRHTDPVYPDMARRAGVGGDVDVAARLSEDGTVSDVCVLASSAPSMGFEEAAVNAVKTWRYEPALYKGEPVPLWFGVHVSFSVDIPGR